MSSSRRLESGRSTSPPHLVFSGWFSWTQPQRDMGGLHRLLHHGHQLLARLSQVKLIAQRSTEGLDDSGRIILATVETAVNDGLEAMARVEATMTTGDCATCPVNRRTSDPRPITRPT